MPGSHNFVYSHPNGEVLGQQLNTAQRMIHDQKTLVEMARLAVVESTGAERIDAPDQQTLSWLRSEKLALQGLRETRNRIRNELGMNRRCEPSEGPFRSLQPQTQPTTEKTLLQQIVASISGHRR